jgi:Protein of unknown function (DUF3618)
MARPDPLPPEPGPDAGVDDIHVDIERTRQELDETVGALADKLDVKKHAEEKAVAVRAKAVPAVPIAAAMAVLAVIGVLLWRRRR